MLFNPLSADWYTDLMDIYRVVKSADRNLTEKRREKVNGEPIPCRIYSLQKNAPQKTKYAGKVTSTDKVSCAVGTDIIAGDELKIIRGGNIGRGTREEKYYAGKPQPYYDPVGGVLSGLEHMEVPLLSDDTI